MGVKVYKYFHIFPKLSPFFDRKSVQFYSSIEFRPIKSIRDMLMNQMIVPIYIKSDLSS